VRKIRNCGQSCTHIREKANQAQSARVNTAGLFWGSLYWFGGKIRCLLRPISRNKRLALPMEGEIGFLASED